MNEKIVVELSVTEAAQQIYQTADRLIAEQNQLLYCFVREDDVNRMTREIAAIKNMAAAIEGMTHAPRKVVIEVSGGVAETAFAPEGIEVEIVDWDNVEEGDGDAIEHARRLLAEGLITDPAGMLDEEDAEEPRLTVSCLMERHDLCQSVVIKRSSPDRESSYPCDCECHEIKAKEQVR